VKNMVLLLAFSIATLTLAVSAQAQNKAAFCSGEYSTCVGGCGFIARTTRTTREQCQQNCANRRDSCLTTGCFVWLRKRDTCVSTTK